MKLFAGNSITQLAQSIAMRMGLTLGQADVTTFSDGETLVEIKENVRGQDVFILQSTCAPTNDHLMELVVMADALRRASARSITAVMPYFGYARQDRRVRSTRVPITAKVVADMLQNVGISRIITVDLHADQIQGFFYIPVDNVYASPMIIDDIIANGVSSNAPILIVSPDVGGVVRARAVTKRVPNADLAIIDKRRPERNEVQVMHVIGDPKGKECVIIDDIVDTAGTLCKAAEALKKHGAKRVVAYCTHPVLSRNALTTIQESVLDELVVTDTIPLSDAAKQIKKIRVMSIDHVLEQTLSRVCRQESVSSMFKEEEG
jgi:ribose-phosphate pyrophosphokinase